MVAAVIPGPSAPNCEQVQYAIRPLVDELEDFYTEGKVISTFKYPNGEHQFYISLISYLYSIFF